MHVFIPISGNQISVKKTGYPAGLKTGLFSQFPLDTGLGRLPFINITGRDFQQKVSGGMTVLPDKKKIAFPIHGNYGNAGLMVNPAQTGPVAVGQLDVFFQNREDAAIINDGHCLSLSLPLIGFHDGQELPFQFFLGYGARDPVDKFSFPEKQ
jgi:hypothetical protein